MLILLSNQNKVQFLGIDSQQHYYAHRPNSQQAKVDLSCNAFAFLVPYGFCFSYIHPIPSKSLFCSGASSPKYAANIREGVSSLDFPAGLHLHKQCPGHRARTVYILNQGWRLVSWALTLYAQHHLLCDLIIHTIIFVEGKLYKSGPGVCSWPFCRLFILSKNWEGRTEEEAHT